MIVMIQVIVTRNSSKLPTMDEQEEKTIEETRRLLLLSKVISPNLFFHPLSLQDEETRQALRDTWSTLGY